MNRRGFLGALFALPLGAKALTEERFEPPDLRRFQAGDYLEAHKINENFDILRDIMMDPLSYTTVSPMEKKYFEKHPDELVALTWKKR